jgi:DNA-binding IclR family transcriptional regulator
MAQRSAALRATQRAPQGIQSLETGGALLHALVARGGPTMLKDLAAEAGMPPAKAHRYLVSFIRLGLVEQDPVTGWYDLGSFALGLGLAALARIDAVRLAGPMMTDLAARLDTTVAAAVWGNRGPTIVRWEESTQAVIVYLRAGAVMPLLASAIGRCFAAWMRPLRARSARACPRHGARSTPRWRRSGHRGWPRPKAPCCRASVRWRYRCSTTAAKWCWR